MTDSPIDPSGTSGDGDPSGLDGVTELGTWAALLGHWTALVKAGEAVVRATPEDRTAHRWRDSITELVTLQAVTFALGDLTRLPVADRALARDRADLAVTSAAAALDVVWRGEEMPGSILEVSDDARRAVERAVYAGLQWIVWAGPGRGRMPGYDAAADPDRDRGTLALMVPGTIVLPGEPVGWWTERNPPTGFASPGWRRIAGPPVQVYRELDDSGSVVADVVTGFDRLPPGLPLISPWTVDGVPVSGAAGNREGWAESNDRAFANAGAVKVRWELEDPFEDLAKEGGSLGAGPRPDGD